MPSSPPSSSLDGCTGGKVAAAASAHAGAQLVPSLAHHKPRRSGLAAVTVHSARLCTTCTQKPAWDTPILCPIRPGDARVRVVPSGHGTTRVLRGEARF